MAATFAQTGLNFNPGYCQSQKIAGFERQPATNLSCFTALPTGQIVRAAPFNQFGPFDESLLTPWAPGLLPGRFLFLFQMAVAAFLARFPARSASKFSSASMKAKIIITPKKAVLDPQGKTVQSALEHMGYTGVTGVHIGKYIEIDLAPGTDKAAAHKAINDAAHKLLSNPVIEDYKLEIE
jgi:phosphoribosylformylglycinamidine synthase PurS subunit